MPPRKSTRKPKITEPKAEEEPSLNIAEEAPDIKPRIHNVTVGAVPPPPPQAVNTSKLSSNDLKSYNSQKSAALPDLSERKRFHAWPVHKRPLDKFISPRSGTLCLPRWYRSGGVNGTKGKEVVEIHVKAGEDLNNTVWRWYDTMVDFSGKEGKHYEGARNYVADGIRPHRHEYIGPSPQLAGYAIHSSPRDEIRIEWWDDFLKDQWIEHESWTTDVEKVETTSEWRAVQK